MPTGAVAGIWAGQGPVDREAPSTLATGHALTTAVLSNRRPWAAVSALR